MKFAASFAQVAVPDSSSLSSLKKIIEFKSDRSGEDGRKGSSRQVAHRLSEEERQRILLTCNEVKYASLPPGQIVPDLADQGIFIGSERSFYRVLSAHGQLHRRGGGEILLTSRT